MQKEVTQIKTIFNELGYKWVEPYMTTEGAINRQEKGLHRGLYYIYPEKNFYFGKAQSTKGGGTVYHRHKTHRPKLDVDLAALYGPPTIKQEPKWTFPNGFREGVVKFLLEGDVSIPDHFIRIKDEHGKPIKDEKGKTRCKPGVLYFPVEHKVNIDTLPVLVWNLDHLGEYAIKEIEKSVITTIWPYCNHPTYLKR